MSKRTNYHDQFINEAFNLFRFNGSVFFRSSLSSPWGIALEAQPYIRFHIAVQGGMAIGTSHDDCIEINQGDIAIVASNQAHWIADNPHSERVEQQAVMEACNLDSPLFQQGTISHQITCCLVHLEPGLTHPLLEKLPAMLAVKNLESNNDIWTLVELINQNLQASTSWQHPITDRLVEVLFIHLLNNVIDSDEGEKILDTLIADRRIFQALNLIHKNPQLNWTVTSLGERVGMSKSTLNRQFGMSIGETPMNYLTNLRLTKAHSLIANSNLAFDEIAAMSGYSSSRSLNKAFVKRFGINLKHHRKAS